MPPRRHAWSPDPNGDCTRCNLPKANGVHDVTVHHWVVIVEAFDLTAKDRLVTVLGPFTDAAEAEQAANARRQPNVTTDVRPLTAA